jgi:hypothetical protein
MEMVKLKWEDNNNNNNDDKTPCGSSKPAA